MAFSELLTVTSNPRLLNERYPDRDAHIRLVTIDLQEGRAVSPEEAERFDYFVGQIVRIKAIGMNMVGEMVEDAVALVVADFKIDILEGKFQCEDAPVAAYISKKTEWFVLQQRSRNYVRKKHEIPLDDEILMDYFGGRRLTRVTARPIEREVETGQRLRELFEYIRDDLTKPQRDVVELLPWYSIDEIADRLDISYKQVVTRAYRAREVLKEKFPDLSHGPIRQKVKHTD